MSRTRKQYSPEFKLKAVLEILKGEKTATQLAGELEVHPVVLAEWKKHFVKTGAQIFEKPRKTSKIHAEAKEKAELFEQIGRLKMELEWLKKKWRMLS
jgi:transposase-like protein